ncbi:hypothetical protein RhiirA1_463004 [Rhizophagus irregularis]|uniref:Uncharacterized protein n=2 Tax=Rhizophagus irregularis TaxID=588596 RepID=A0A2I1F762_9GLOM|nr:hypothetical protein RhiirA1_463004 [Rhizophagus irregularis]PKY30218.1 hypothetical protein RhiirB3_447196 [Rhizophagus irregularis]
MFAILNLETNELTLTEPNERLDNNFAQTDEFGIYIIDDSKNDAIEMKVGGSFKDWDMIQYVVDSYAKQHGFIVRKCQKDLDANDKSTNCPWQVSFYFEKQVGLTPKNLCLPQLVLDKIKHYTIDGRLGAGQQYDLLIKEFP